MKLISEIVIFVLTLGIATYSVTPGVQADESAAGPLGDTVNAESPRVVKLTLQRFKFSPEVIHLKAGEPVTFQLTSMDVKHGFFSRPLKLDAIVPPGKTTEVTIDPHQPGTFTVICDNFCGVGHGNMKMKMVVE